MSIVTNTAIVGVVLNQLFDRAERLIDNARQAGIDVVQMGGSELRRTIQFAQANYSAALLDTVQRAGALAAGTLNQLEQLILDAEANAAIRGQELARRAQAIANTMPLSNAHVPQLSTVSPCNIFRSGDNPADIFFTFSGNFFDASTAGYEPTLTFNNAVIQPNMNSTTDLVFRIPFRDVFPNNPTDRIVYSDGTLTVPWISGAIINVRQQAIFRVLACAFPPSPGTITLNYNQENYHEQTLRQGKIIHSQRGVETEVYGDQYTGGNNDHKNKDFLGRGTAGWSIIPGSSYVHKNRYDGDYEAPEFISEDPINNTFLYRGSSIYHKVGCSGIMEFDICFKEKTYTHQAKSEAIQLTWGGTHLISDDKVTHPTPQGHANPWNITFTPFDSNNALTYNGDATHRYLRIQRTQGGYRITATLPDSVQ